MSTNANLERYVNKVFRNKYRKKEYKDKVFHHTAMSSYVCMYVCICIYIYIYIHTIELKLLQRFVKKTIGVPRVHIKACLLIHLFYKRYEIETRNLK